MSLVHELLLAKYSIISLKSNYSLKSQEFIVLFRLIKKCTIREGRRKIRVLEEFVIEEFKEVVHI